MIKKIGLVLFLLSPGFVANAASIYYKCFPSELEGGSSYLLVLDTDGKNGVILSRSNTSPNVIEWEMVYGNAKLDRLPSSFYTLTGTDNTKTDWSKEKDCFKIKKLTLKFNLNFNYSAPKDNPELDAKKVELQMFPNIEILPIAVCKPPEFLRPAPIQLTCNAI